MTFSSPRPAAKRLSVVVTLFVLVALVLTKVHTSEYQIVPGSATPLSPLVSVHGVTTDAPSSRHGFMMVDVMLQPLSLLSSLSAHLFGGSDIVTMSDLVAPGVPASDFDRQSYLDMQLGKQTAAALAFSAAGWNVHAQPAGAVVEAALLRSPARAAGVHVADRIVAVDGRPTLTTCALVAALHDLAPRTRVQLRVVPSRVSAAGAVTYGAARVVAVTTARAPSGLTSSCAGVVGPPRSWLGVSTAEFVNYQLPATVQVATAYVGGPSAGLAMTLTAYDRITSGRLSGPYKVAVTGTIDASGAVGDVGGVAEKTQAAITAGASYFLVPSAEVGIATTAAKGRVHVVGVDSFRQALAELRRLGGDAPVPLTKPVP
jgi:PDZ domain-containing protein